jgi:hypothetical protein
MYSIDYCIPTTIMLPRKKANASTRTCTCSGRRNICQIIILASMMILVALLESRDDANAYLPSGSLKIMKSEDNNNTGTISKKSYTPFLPIPTHTSIHKLLPNLMAVIAKDKEKGRLVDFGAGVRDDDPMFPFVDQGWEALLVDGDPNQEELMAKRFPSENSKTVISYITADTVPKLLSDYGFDKDVDLLKIDIDSFDCFVMKTVLTVTRPSVIVMEVNVKFPSHVRFAMVPGFDSKQHQFDFDSEQRGHVYGCSLAYQVYDLMRPNGYEILHLDTNNAIYFDQQRTTILELKEFQPPSLEELYETGYWDHPERGSTFSFNNQIAHWNEYFSKQLFRELQRLFLTKTSHKHHHVYIGDAQKIIHNNDDKLWHGCFDEIGKLEYEHIIPENCTISGTIK